MMMQMQFKEIKDYYHRLLDDANVKKYIVESINPTGRASSVPVNGQYRSITTKDKYILYKKNNKPVMLAHLCDIGFAGKEFANRQDLLYYKGKIILTRYNYNNGSYTEYGDVFYICKEEMLQSTIGDKFRWDVNASRIHKADKVAIKNICSFLKMSVEETEEYYSKIKRVEEQVKERERQLKQLEMKKSYIEYTEQDNSEIFLKIKNFHINLLDTKDDQVYEVTRKRYADKAWLSSDTHRVTRERKDVFLVSNLKGKDIMFIYKENANMPFDERTDIFYYCDNLVSCTKGRYCESYRVYKKGREAECLKEIKQQFEYTASEGSLKNVSKAAMVHICNFLQIDNTKVEHYYNVNCKKRRPSK